MNVILQVWGGFWFCLFFFVFSIFRYSEQKKFKLEIIVVFHTEVLSGLKTCSFINRFYCVVRV